MSGADAVAGAVQLVGGVALAPLLPGLVQHWKARLQGRRGPTPLQPYRELRRLWGKSAVDAGGQRAPSTGSRPPSSARRSPLPCSRARSGGRARAGASATTRSCSLGLLALARFARRGRGLGRRQRLLADGRQPRPHARRSSSRRRSCSSLAVAALVAGTTDLVGVVAATAGHGRLDEPGARARRASPSRSSSSPRPAASRSTTPTRTSS